MTRILQESIGGNSRTTLIVNCSPSAFNASETISTLRFGVRAKSIKNKVHINAELPPEQLKILLQKAKSDLLNLQFYTQLLETEVTRWRNGFTVPQDEWVKHTAAVAHLLADTNLDTLILNEQPTNTGLSGKERDEFLARENEWSDLLAERELEISEKDLRIEHLSKGLDQLRKGDQLIIDVGYFLYARCPANFIQFYVDESSTQAKN